MKNCKLPLATAFFAITVMFGLFISLSDRLKALILIRDCEKKYLLFLLGVPNKNNKYFFFNDSVSILFNQISRIYLYKHIFVDALSARSILLLDRCSTR